MREGIAYSNIGIGMLGLLYFLNNLPYTVGAGTLHQRRIAMLIQLRLTLMGMMISRPLIRYAAPLSGQAAPLATPAGRRC